MKDDVISRQAAIDTVMEFMPSLTTPDGCGQFDREISEAQEMFVDIGQALNNLPSARPEPLTDREQRIFLAAMGREEKVCKECDEAWLESKCSYEDTLVRTCREIERKVKGALWT